MHQNLVDFRKDLIRKPCFFINIVIYYYYLRRANNYNLGEIHEQKN